MFRTLVKTSLAIGAAKYIYDEGYNDGQNNRNYFFKSYNSFKNQTLKIIENHVPPNERGNFRNDVNHAKHKIHKAHNEVRKSLGLGPR